MAFAENELKNPTRSIASTVKTIFPDCPYVSVKTDGELPKEQIMQAMEKINAVILKKRLPIGGVVLKNVCGVKIVATSDMTGNPAPCRVHGAACEKHKQASSESNSENRRYTAMALSKKRCPILSGLVP